LNCNDLFGPGLYSNFSYDNIYIDSDLYVYFLSHIHPQLCLGSLIHDYDQIISILKNHSQLPDLIQTIEMTKMDDLKDFVDLQSEELHTKESLINKLIHKKYLID